MLNTTPIGWDKKTLEFVTRTTGNLFHLSLEAALQQIFKEASRTCRAKECYFLNLNGLIIQGFSPKKESVVEISFQDYFEKDLLKLKEKFNNEVLIEEVGGSEILKKSTCILKVPVCYNDIIGLLIFGFEVGIEKVGNYSLFTSLVQAKIQDVFSLYTVSMNSNLSYKFMDSLVNASNDPAVFIECLGNTAWVNAKGADLLGVPVGANGKSLVIKSIEELSLKSEVGIDRFKEMLTQIEFNQSVIYNWHFLNPSMLSLEVSVSVVNLESTHGMLWTFRESANPLGSYQTKIKLKELSHILTSVLNCTLSGIMAFKTVRDKKGEINDFVCIMSNQPAERFFRLKRHDLHGEYFKSLIPINIREELFDHFVKVVKTNIPYNAEIDYKWNGKVKWYHTIVLKLNDGFVATFSDITDRKLNEEKLVNERAKLKGILENTKDLIFSINNKGRITNLNSSFYKTVFKKRGIKIKVGDRISPSMYAGLFLPLWKKYFREAFAGKQVIKETSIPDNGNLAFYEFSFNPIKTKSNIITEVAVFGHDITKRKAAQFEIRKKSQLLKGVLNNLPVIIFRINPDHLFTEFEGSGSNKIIGIGNSIIGENAYNLFPELSEIKPIEIRNDKTRFFSRGETNGEPWVFEIYIFQDETNLNGIIGFGIDMTEQQELEESLFKAKELAERASLAKSYFLANQSHEIRTPINTILGFAQLIKNKGLAEESEEYLDYIISSGQNLLGIIGNILDLTRIEDGKLELAYETFNVQQKIRKELTPYDFQAKEKGLSFDLVFDENFPDFLIGDKEKINQIIVNLISNSIKFTQEGSIRVTFSCLSINAIDEIAKIRVMVSDTGIGIPFETQKKIFSQFAQGNKSISKKFGGSGLGLAIVRELVLAMDGEVGVLSPGELRGNEVHKGSTFWFTLPLKIGQPHIDRKDRPLDVKSLGFDYNVEVLLVDDNPVNQRLGSTILDNIGCKVSIASNGKEALNMLDKQSFDLILMDVHMPVMDGRETTAIIRNRLNLEVPIIGLSANVQKKNIDFCLQIGMNDYLGRPYALSDFYEKVVHWVKPKNGNNSVPKIIPHDQRNKLTGLKFLNHIYKGDKTKISVMVDRFIAYQGNMLEEISQEILKSNLETVSQLAHELRSSVQMVGEDKLHDLLVDLEIQSKKSKNKVEIYKLFLQVKEVCIVASNALKDSISLEEN